MIYRVILPRVDPGMDAGTIVEWIKREGENVEKGEIVASIETLKAIVDIEAPASGVIRKVLYSEGAVVPVNKVIALIGDPNEEIPDLETKPETPKTEPESGKMKVSPAAKRLAREHKVDLATIDGTGPEGRIVRGDVLKLIKVRSPPGLVKERVEKSIILTPTRKIIAERMTQSYRDIPQASMTMDMVMSETRKIIQKSDKRISYTAVFIKAVADSLKENKLMNSTLEGEEIKILRDINIGVAVATDKGLVVPVVRDAHRKSLEELTKVTGEIVERARSDRLNIKEVLEGTFTVTNLGMFGVDSFIPIINPNEAGILAVGMIKDKPSIEGGRIVIKPIATLTLTFDHRIVDGATAAKFMTRVKELIENPNQIKF